MNFVIEQKMHDTAYYYSEELQVEKWGWALDPATAKLFSSEAEAQSVGDEIWREFKDAPIPDRPTDMRVRRSYEVHHQIREVWQNRILSRRP